MSNKTSIAIIGGGAGGTIAAIHLLFEFRKPLRIYLFEKRQKALFRGIAYASELDFEPLNVPVSKMSIFSDFPLDFYEWLIVNRQQQSSVKITQDSFVSRRWFGDYLTERLSEAKGKANNASLEVIISEAIDISLSSKTGKYRIEMDDRSFKESDYLIFATGNEPPADLLNNLEKALLGRKYVANPWLGDPFEYLSPKDDVLIIGSGLRMVDHAVSLYRRKHAGKIYSFSRHGLLPLTQQIGLESEVNFNSDAPQILYVMGQLREAAKAAAKRGVDWQQIINSIRDDTPLIWKRLSVSSKRIFLRRLKHFWEIHRHRMPAESAQLIDEMRTLGKLELLAGTRKQITVNNGNILFQFLSVTDKVPKSVKINYVINCTGPSADYSGYSNRLIRNLLIKGWMKQDILQLGIETGCNGEILTLKGTPLPNAYAIGPLRKATEWESTVVREIKIQAEQLALDIALFDEEPSYVFTDIKSEAGKGKYLNIHIRDFWS